MWRCQIKLISERLSSKFQTAKTLKLYKNICRPPSIGSSSIFHDANLVSESRIFAMPDTCLERGSATHVTSHVSRNTGSPILAHINAQNRPRIISGLFSVFAFLLGSFDKESLEWNCRVSDRMIMRYNMLVIY